MWHIWLRQNGSWNVKTLWTPQMRLCENLEILICHIVTVWEALGKTRAACALQDNLFGITTTKGQSAQFAAPEAWQERAQPDFCPSRTRAFADWATTSSWGVHGLSQNCPVEVTLPNGPNSLCCLLPAWECALRCDRPWLHFRTLMRKG